MTTTIPSPIPDPDKDTEAFLQLWADVCRMPLSDLKADLAREERLATEADRILAEAFPGVVFP